MTPGWRRSVRVLLYTAGLAWPLDIFQYLPWMGVSLLALVTTVLAVAVAVDLRSGTKLRVPFEVLAPVGLLAILLAIAAMTGAGTYTRDGAGALMLLILTAHVASDPADMRQVLWVGSLSGGVVALLTLFTPFLGLMPTAYSLDTGVTFTFSEALSGGTHILLASSCMAAYVASCRLYRPVERAVATFLLVVFFVVLMGKLLFYFRDTGTFPMVSYADYSWVQWAGLGLSLWLVLRVAVKAALKSGQPGDPLGILWCGMALVTVLVLACAPVHPRLYQGFLLGLACGSALPSTNAESPLPWPKWVVAVVGVLVFVNLFAVFPGHVRDPRQYDAAARVDYRSGAYDRLLRRLEHVEAYAPGERRTHLWRARTALALGFPNWAGYEFGEAIAPPGGSLLLEAPTRSEIEDFVVEMRDAAASLPEDRAVCAYERVLLDCGEVDSAMYSLRLQTTIALVNAEATSPAPFAAVVSSVVGDRDLLPALNAWPAEALMTLLVQWGAQRFPSPRGAPDLPYVLMAQREPGSLVVELRFGKATYAKRFSFPNPGVQDLLPMLAADRLVWKAPVTNPDTGEQRYGLFVESNSREVELGAAYRDVDGGIVFRLGAPDPGTPFTPALALVLSE